MLDVWSWDTAASADAASVARATGSEGFPTSELGLSTWVAVEGAASGSAETEGRVDVLEPGC